MLPTLNFASTLTPTGLASLGSHTIEVRVAGNGRVDIDGFVIFR